MQPAAAGANAHRILSQPFRFCTLHRFGTFVGTPSCATHKLFRTVEPSAFMDMSTGAVQQQSSQDSIRKPFHVIPAAFCKTIHLLRHGEGTHNVAGHVDHDAYKIEDFFDASLTDLGWSQAIAVSKRNKQSGLAVDLVVTSPLMRALETGVGAFGGGVWQEGDAATPLMLPKPGVPGLPPGLQGITSAGAPKFVAYELCREHLGIHPCDRRRPTAFYRAAFPGIDFSQITSENDELWRADHRETKEEIQARGMAFLQWLMRRPEQRIAVVSHSSFLHYMLEQLVNVYHSEAVQNDLIRWFENGEMRTIVIGDAAASAAPAIDPYHCPGGIPTAVGSSLANGAH